jgi:hypothetical protein
VKLTPRNLINTINNNVSDPDEILKVSFKQDPETNEVTLYLSGKNHTGFGQFEVDDFSVIFT